MTDRPADRPRLPALLSLLALAVALAGRAGAAPAADPWPLWDAHDPASTATVDHSAWQAFLDTHLRAGEDGINRVAYNAVTEEDRAALKGYLATLTALDPRTLARDEQMAYWINLYNALTVEVVLRHPDKDSILRMGKGLFSFGPWDNQLVTVAGQPLTLNDIEHRILRPVWRDHRIHFAVNCASLGCPNLTPRAYTVANLEEQLAANETDYINHLRGVQVDARGRLQLSQIFEWYRSDFADSEEALLAYLAEHHRALADQLRGWTGRIRYDYDWTLNSVEHR